MVALRLYLGGELAGDALVRKTVRDGDAVRKAIRETAARAEQNILSRGRADIGAAGRFSGTFISGLTVKVGQGGGNYRISVSHSDPRFWPHERGGIIKGKPLLWIPLSSAREARHVYARNFPQRLIRVTRKKGGVPLLLSLQDKKPKYVGVPSVTIRKKFHIAEIVADEAKKLKDTYREVKRKG